MKRQIVLLLLLSLVLTLPAVNAYAVLEDFALLGASTVTNTGSSVIDGDVGLSPGSSVTGFPPGVITAGHSLHIADAVAGIAQTELTTAYNLAAGAPVTQTLTGQDLGGMTLVPGVYFFSSSAQLTGNLWLDGLGLTDPQWIFQIGSTLTTASSSNVKLKNGATRCDVYWQIGTSATLGSGTSFVGNIMANESITLVSGGTLLGRALARTAAVTVDNWIVDPSSCGEPVLPTVVPEASSMALVMTTLIPAAVFFRRRK